MIKHILFDCDGVLVDTEITAAKVMVEALNELGVDITLDYYLKNLTGSTFSTIVEQFLDGSFAGDKKQQFIDEAERKTVEKVVGIKCVEEVLQSLILPKSIVSNSHIWHVKHVTQRVAIDHYFTEHIFSSELVPKPKPSPDVYDLAKSQLQLNAKELITIEDSATGVRSAVASGIPVIGFAGASHILPGHAEKLSEAGAFKVVHSMIELKKMLVQII